MPSADLELIRRSGRFCRDPRIKQKLALFERALALGEVTQACREAGKQPRYFYYWWNRFRDSGFQLDALERKPHERRAPPKKSSAQIKDWVRHYRKHFRYSPELIALHLEQKHQTRVSKSTVYRILKSEGLRTRRRKARALKLTKAQIPSVAPSPQALLAGRRLGGRFVIEKEIGRGGSGIVYRAKDLRRAEQAVALKVVGPLPGKNSGLDLLLKKEFQTLASLHHRHLGQVFDFGQEDGEVFFSSELIEGEDLLTFAREANLNVVFQSILQTLRGLDYLHSRGVLHLDLKPQNILIADPERTGEPSVKIIDFGNAQWLKKGGKEFEEFTGSPPYSAPEIILEQAPSPASDLYSLGILFHQIFSQGLPFRTQDPLEIMKLQIYEDPEPVQGLHPALPESFAEILRRMVARDPADRFPTVTALLKAINDSLGESFTLRSEKAPGKVLEESDWLFHSALFSQLLSIFSEKKSRVCVLSGLPGVGKSHFARKLREALQIRGMHPWWCESFEELKALLPKKPSFPALLIDGFELNAEEMIPVLSSLENLGIPVLLNTRLTRRTAMNPHEWMTLDPINPSQIRDFLDHEVIDHPYPKLAQNILETSGGIPLQIEKLFQALREEGFLQWSGEGWRWAADETVPLDFKDLEARQAARWKERLRTLEGILQFSALPLDARALEGMLGLEAGALEEKLATWTEQGLLRMRKIKKLPHYSWNASEGNQPELEMKNWEWAEANLAKLYEAAAYDQGVRWTEYLFARAKAEEIPEKISLLGARHLVLAGQTRRAQEVLPKHPPASPERAGLYFEILGRIQWGLGDLSAAETSFASALRSV